MFPEEIYNQIAIFAGTHNVIHTLKLSNSFYQKNVSLVYGQVQSGKTNMIKSLILKSNLKCVLIIQNSLLVFQQYMERFKDIPYETVHSPNTNAKVFILMHNSSQYRKFLQSYDHYLFSLLMDESDITMNNPLISYAANQYHITATPFNYLPTFDQIIHIRPPDNYYGIERVQFVPKTYDSSFNTDFDPIIRDFISTKQGILLINQFSFVKQMNQAALDLSTRYTIPIIVLSSVKKSFNMVNLNLYETMIFKPLLSLLNNLILLLLQIDW